MDIITGGNNKIPIGECSRIAKGIRRDENGIWLNAEDADFIQNYTKMQKTISDNKDKIAKLQCEVEKYRKAFENAKKERDCQIAKYQKKIEELTAERDFISKDSISVHQEPIDIAKDLINAEGEYEHNPLAKELYKEDKGTYRIFDVSELRQIAEHLLVYCNHNSEAEE